MINRASNVSMPTELERFVLRKILDVLEQKGVRLDDKQRVALVEAIEAYEGGMGGVPVPGLGGEAENMAG